MSYLAKFRVWRGDGEGGDLQDYEVEVNEGEVVLDVIHRLQATQTPDLAVPLELQGRQVRFLQRRDQRHAEADVHVPDERVRARARPSRSPRCGRSR